MAQQTKSCKLKVVNQIDRDFLTPFINEYSDFYNKVSFQLSNKLTTLTIDDIVKTVNKNGTQKYITYALSEEWKDKPMYFLFNDNYSTNNANNLLYEYIKISNFDDYQGNIINLSETYYRRQGYIKLLISNLRTKIREIKANIKSCRIDENSDIEVIKQQTILEMHQKNLFSKKEWEEHIKYHKEKEYIDNSKVERLNLLYDCFCKYEDTIEQEAKEIAINQLKEFGGCTMNNNKSATITIQNYRIENIDNSLGFMLHLPLNGKIYQIELWGHRQLKEGNKDEYQTLVDITKNHGQNITFKLEDNEVYIIFSYDYEIEKPEPKFEKVIGIDINIKHALLTTNIIDNGNINYINIYKYVLQFPEFTELLSEEELKTYKQFSENLTFSPIECELLLERYNGNSKKEKVFSKLLYNLQNELKETGKQHDYIYVCCVNKIRSQYMSYFKLYQVYTIKQKEYDTKMCFVDINTSDKNFMDKRRFENPFRNTSEAISIIEKMNNILQTIEGCRKNIIQYVYKIFYDNGYDTIALENLDNSNFEKHKSLPSIVSFLNFHKVKGKTIQEAQNMKSVGHYIENNYYELITDENGLIIDANFTEKALSRINKCTFYNLAPKALHFASIKDEFIQLSNKSNLLIALVPAEYTSQMDSLTHNMYAIYKNGKLVKADKRRVRKNQENHINGLNADINAANNIAFLIQDKTRREIFCVKPKNYDKKGGYNMPVLEPTKKGQAKILAELKKLDAIQILPVD